MTLRDGDELFEWTDVQERNVAQWGDTALSYAMMHNKTGRHYEKWYKRMGLPVLILTSIISTLEFVTAANSCDTAWINILAGLLAMICAALSAAHNFLGFQERYQKHYAVSVEYDALYMEIAEQLSYYRQQRVNVRVFIRNMMRVLKTLKKSAPDIPEHILDKFIKDVDRVIDTKPIRINVESAAPLPLSPSIIERKKGNDKDDNDNRNDNDNDKDNDDTFEMQDEFATEMARRRDEQKKAQSEYYLNKSKI